MGSTFSQNFKNALSASDQEFAEYIAGIGRYSDFCRESAEDQEKIAPSGPQREHYLGELTRPDATRIDGPLKVKIDQRPPQPHEYAIPNNTGIASYIYGTTDYAPTADSVDRLYKNNLRIGPDKCIPCLPPADAAQLYPESVVQDPAQLRASQLMRMVISLHEVGHYHFKSENFSPDQKTSGNEAINSYDQEQGERYADLFALAFIIRELGQEGIRFAKQMLSGMRDQTHGSGGAYDNGTAIALLIKRYEKDPEAFRATSPENIPNLALEILQDSSPSQKQDSILQAELSKAGLGWGKADEAHPYERAQQRLQWYQEQLSKQKAGDPVNQAAMDVYERYMAPGDQAMLSKEQMQTNLQQMAPTTSSRGMNAPTAANQPAAIDRIEMGLLRQMQTELGTETPNPIEPIRPSYLPYKSNPSFS